MISRCSPPCPEPCGFRVREPAQSRWYGSRAAPVTAGAARGRDLAGDIGAPALLGSLAGDAEPHRPPECIRPVSVTWPGWRWWPAPGGRRTMEAVRGRSAAGLSAVLLVSALPRARAARRPPRPPARRPRRHRRRRVLPGRWAHRDVIQRLRLPCGIPTFRRCKAPGTAPRCGACRCSPIRCPHGSATSSPQTHELPAPTRRSTRCTRP